jgi:hypothetical protein
MRGISFAYNVVVTFALSRLENNAAYLIQMRGGFRKKLADDNVFPPYPSTNRHSGR